MLVNAISIEAPGTDLAAIATFGSEARSSEKGIQGCSQPKRTVNQCTSSMAKVGGSGSAGNGIKIAILDTGIDITNPLFAAAGFTAPPGFPRGDLTRTNNKVIVAKAFGLSTAADQNGHGTNVAGIAAGDFNTTSPLAQISGVAPRAFLVTTACWIQLAVVLTLLSSRHWRRLWPMVLTWRT